MVSVDACSTERRTRAYLDAIASVTDQPVRTLINTHHHGDHTFGNCLFAGATIVAHERCRQEMLALGPPGQAPFWTEVDWGELELALPFLTCESQVRVWVDDLACEVRHVGAAAHTTNDPVTWLPTAARNSAIDPGHRRMRTPQTASVQPWRAHSCLPHSATARTRPGWA